MSKSIIRFPRWSPVLIAGLCAGGIIPAAACLAVDPRPDAAAAPATQPAKAIDPAIRALIVKLGDDDPAVRDDATRKLSDLGKAAVPALREAAAGDDLEASARARDILHHIERRLPPPAPPRNGMGRSQSVSMSMDQGVRTIDVDDNGRKVHIVCRADGQIEMSVTGIEDGKEATETYRAKDADELKHDNPEAFAIYDQWAGAHGALTIRGRGLFGGGARVRIMPGGPPAGGRVAPVQPVNPQDLELRIEQQQKQIEELQRRLEAETEQRTHDRMRGKTDKEPAPSDKEKAEDKPADKPRTQPENGG